MKRWALLVLGAMLAIAGCGDDGGETAQFAEFAKEMAKMPSCENWQGKEVSAEQWRNGCASDKSVMLSMRYDCKDGSTLHWNDWGWGFGGKPAQRHVTAPGQQEKVPPKDVIKQCLG